MIFAWQQQYKFSQKGYYKCLVDTPKKWYQAATYNEFYVNWISTSHIILGLSREVVHGALDMLSIST